MDEGFRTTIVANPEAYKDATIVDQNSSCVACSKPDSFDDMVACDLCDSWWHQCCAGVTKSIKDRDWTCPRCLPVPSRANSIRSTSTVRKALLEIKLQRIEEEKDLKRKQFEMEQKCLDEKYRLLEAAAVDDDIDSEGSHQEYHRRRQRTEDWVSSKTSNVSERLEGAVGGVNERRTDAQPIDAEQTIQQVTSVVRELNRKLANGQKEPDPLYDNLKVILKACQIQNNASVSGIPYTGTVPKDTRMLAPPIAPRTLEQYERREETVFPDSTESSTQKQFCYWDNPQVEPECKAPVPQHIAPERDVMPSNLTPSPQAGLSGNRIQHSSIVLSTPSASQIAARQALSRDLPIFSGNPADWPVFIANYNYTTEACGFNCGENMIRLQRCLKGPAYEAVRSKLVIPSLVPAVIDALEMRFGRPESLIETFINNVKSTTPPRADRLETLIDFGEKVQTLCDHIIAADLTDHLANPQLMKDLVEKLPPDYRMKWAEFREPLSKVNLQTFREFMNRIVKNAYRVTGARSFVEEVKSVKRDRGKNLNYSFLHSETGGSDSGQSAKVSTDERKPIVCAVCGKINHRARECEAFQALSVDERWARVRNLGLCRTCLYGHGRRRCRNTKRCGINGCEKRHHPSLHSDPKTQDAATTTVASLHAAMNHQTDGTDPTLFFRILPVTVYQGQRSIDTFAFVDEGSALSMMDTELADKLGLRGRKQPLCLTWTAQVSRTEQNSRRVSFEISGLGKPKRFRMTNVCTVDSLGLPVQSLPISDLQERYQYLRGIPVSGYQNAVPQILIGVDHLKLVVPLRVREGGQEEPTAVKTRLVEEHSAIEEAKAEVKPTLHHLSDQDTPAVSILKVTTICVNDPLLEASVGEQVDEHVSRRHAHSATVAELTIADVANLRKPGKILLPRAAAAPVDDIALNTMLFKGSELLTSLLAILFCFRHHVVGVSDHIQEICQQVSIRNANHRDVQGFFWRKEPTREREARLIDVIGPKYCDKILAGHFLTVEELKLISAKMTEVHRSGSAQLRNVSSNSTAEIDHCDERAKTITYVSENKAASPVRILVDVTKCETVNLFAKPKENILNWVQDSPEPTNREVISCAMWLFDVLCTLSLHIVRGEVLSRKWWWPDEGWKEERSNDCFNHWRKWLHTLLYMRWLTIPEECTQDLLKRASTKVKKKLVQFWRRWVLEYLPTLTKRIKWFNETRDIAVGDVVFIVNEGKRNSWERGLIVELIAASDGRIRQAWVRTGNGVYRKPIAKLATLEVSSRKDGSRELPDCEGGSIVGNDEDLKKGSGGDETEASRRFHRGENVGKLATVPVRDCLKVAEK
ncbi:uncharacterized protein LOC129742213 [Uranotaenia lowii]|uniref:uncharacterized protein LOC129742213 n=1 Tax=Uranotaenia lowii TaxID=190385 RepID=UPI0024797B2D|nr:uncharacterized protein LOC129742213 [Uranotaenia lowii]